MSATDASSASFGLQYHHSAILTTAEDSFAKRVKSERSAFNSAPTDRFYDPAVFRVYIGLLSVSDEFNISEDACIWLHEALANQPLLVRPAMLFDECEVEGMTVSLSRKARQSHLTPILTSLWSPPDRVVPPFPLYLLLPQSLRSPRASTYG